MSSAVAAPAKKDKRSYARILDYLEAKHRPVYELYNSLGMQSSLTPKRGAGLTFLLPSKEMVAQMNAQLENGDAEAVTDILSGLVVQDYLVDVTEWSERMDDCPTLLATKVPVQSVSAGKVTLIGGAELTLDTHARFLKRVGTKERDPMCIWKVHGVFDVKAGGPAEYKYVGTSGKPKKIVSKKVKSSLATEMTNRVTEYLRKVETIATRAARKNFIMHVEAYEAENAKVCHYLMQNLPACSDLAKKIFELPAWNHVARFYLTFDNENYIPNHERDELIQGIEQLANTGQADSDMKADYLAFISREWVGEKCAVATEEGRIAIRAERENVASALMARSAIDFGKKLEEVYKVYATNNTFGNIKNFSFDNVFKTHTRSSGQLKLVMDQWTYFIHMISTNCDSFDDILSYITASNKFGVSVGKYISFGDWLPGQQQVKNVGNIFVRYNGAFMPTATSIKMVTDDGEFDEESASNPYGRDMCNDEAVGLEQYNRYSPAEYALSERTRKEIARYQKKHGKLPDF
jgi:hypothetical protein